jgi:hypothetical protein
MKAMDLKAGDTVTRPATQRGEPPMVTRTVRTVIPIPGTEGVRVLFTDATTILYPNDNNV